MSETPDRTKGFTVVLKDNLRSEDCRRIKQLLEMISGVIAVEPIKADSMDLIEQARVRDELGQKLLTIIYPNLYKKDSDNA